MGRPIRIASAGAVIDDGTLGAGWAAVGGCTENAPANITLPDGSTASLVSFTGTGDNTNIFFKCTSSLAAAAGKRGLEMAMYLDISADSDAYTVPGYYGYVRMRDATPTHQMEQTLCLKPGWNYCRFGRGSFTNAAGTPNWDTTTWADVLVKVNAVANITPKVWVKGLQWAGYSRPQVVLTFDDGYTSVIDTAKAIMDTYGFKGNVGVISSKVGTAGYMTIANLNTLHDAGWALCNHTDTHAAAPFLTAASQATCYGEINTCQAYLIAQGWTRDNEHLHFITPYGEWSPNYWAAATQANCVAYYGIGVGDNAAPNSMSTSDVGIDIKSFHRLNVINTWSAANVIAYIDSCIASGRPIIINFHKIVTTPTVALEFSTANFTSVVQHLYKRSALLDVVTLPELYARMILPTS